MSLKPVIKTVSRQAPERRLTRGRSRDSILIIAWKHLHVFVWTPRLGPDSTGLTIRHRWRNNHWYHYRLIVMQRNYYRGKGASSTRRGGQQFRSRPTLTLFELARWRTANGTYNRHGLKSYVRLKVGSGGTQLSNRE